MVKHKVELVSFYYCIVEIHISSFSFTGNKSLFPNIGKHYGVFNTVCSVFRLRLAKLWCSNVPVLSVHQASIKTDPGHSPSDVRAKHQTGFCSGVSDATLVLDKVTVLPQKTMQSNLGAHKQLVFDQMVESCVSR